MHQLQDVPIAESVQSEVASVPRWRHTIPLPGGVTTPGNQNTLCLAEHFGQPKDLTGQRVLDIGCSDGFFSIECEKRGVAHVLAVDDFSSVYIDSPSGFCVAHKLLNSKVDFRILNLFQVTLEEFGEFDLVLFLGVLYHLRHPLLALEHIARLCRGQLITETLMAEVPAESWWQRLAWRLVRRAPRRPYMEFIEGAEVNRDPTNWWAPSPEGMVAMLRSGGYCDAKQVPGTEGAFHAFHPRFGEDVDQFVAAYPADVVARALAPTNAAGDDPASRLRSLSITDFASVRQCAAEIMAKRWHQDERWKKK